MTVRERVEALADAKNADFVSRLTPGVGRERVLGARLPALRKLAKELRGTSEAAGFMAELPHAYLEEDHLHAMLIGTLRDYDGCLAALESFLPFVDNWGVCDTLRPAALMKRPEDFLGRIDAYLASELPYTQRFGVGMLMTYFLGEHFDPAQPERVAALSSEHYYVRMMQAWYFATALAKQYDSAVVYLERNRLEKWTHNKTIQKALESRRVSDAHKAYLRTLKR